jgi:hypothetical protein
MNGFGVRAWSLGSALKNSLIIGMITPAVIYGQEKNG